VSFGEVVAIGLAMALGSLLYFGFGDMWDALQAPLRVRRFARGRRVSVPLWLYDAIGVAPDERCSMEPGFSYKFSIRCQQGQPASAGRWISTLEPRDEFIRCLSLELNDCHRVVGDHRVIHLHGWEGRHVSPVISVRMTDYGILVETLKQSRRLGDRP
jgi:hypothetical protein